MANWHLRWMDRARQLASWSKDPSTKVGAVLVRQGHSLAEGYNGFPKGISDEETRLQDRQTKYLWTIHAEMNAIIHAARLGVSCVGASVYSTFPPCPQCAVALVQAGIQAVFLDWNVEMREDQRAWWETSVAIFKEAGIPVVFLDGDGE